MSRTREIAARIDAADRFATARAHGLEDVAAASLRAGESDAAFRARLANRLATRELGGAFSFRRALICMSDGKLDGVEREMLEEVARIAGTPFDPSRVVIPFGLFARDLTSASALSGGYLVGTETGEALDVLRPWSVTARAGITVLENLRGNQVLPRTTTKATPVWLSTEGSQATPSTPSLGAMALTPKTAGAGIKFSRQLSLQAAAENYVRRELLRTVATAVDQAVLTGTGAAGQPTGLLNSAGLLTQSGTSLGWTGVLNMKQQCASANAADASLAFLTTPEVRELLEARERAAGSGFVWEDESVASRPAYASTDVPAATMICGDWSDVLFGLWGQGFVFEVNPFDPAGFKVGIIEARVLVSCDVAIGHPTSWCVATSIT